MLNIIKTEWYKLRTTKLFLILAAVVFALNALIQAAVPIVTRIFLQSNEGSVKQLSEMIASPFALGLLMIPVFISAVSFLYADFSGGYIKNLAGQVGNRGKLIFGKLFIIAVHNLIFFAVAVLSNVLGSVIGGQVVADAAVFGGVMTLLLKWLLSVALCSILLFVTTGIRNKTFASIIAVIFSINALSLLYMGLDALLGNVLKLEGFSVTGYMPDALMNSVNAITNTNVVNTVVVSAVCIALFTALSYITFRKRDVK